MRTSTLIALSSAILMALSSASALSSKNGFASSQDELGKNWSLFSEYYKIGEYDTAIPFGWEVILIDSTRFKTVYQKLANCFFNLYQKADSTERQPYADTMLVIYDKGIRSIPEKAPVLWLLKGYALENYFYGREMEAIEAYGKSRELDPDGMEMAYIDRLGILYIKNALSDPSLKKMAVDLYRWAKEKFPNDPLPVQRLQQLVTDPQELITLAEEDLKKDPENVEKIWAAAVAYIDAEVWEGAERHLRKLTTKSPDNLTYWKEYEKVM
jgi:tetratricopeptide (TPR) repeat protein